eukprot:scaffold31253_cov33-Tisochrysis_lutea.AAC.3
MQLGCQAEQPSTPIAPFSRVEEVFGEEPRLVFSCPSDPLAYRGSWQDRPIGQSPLAGIRLSYYNNSKTIHNSNILQASSAVYSLRCMHHASTSTHPSRRAGDECAPQIVRFGLRFLSTSQQTPGLCSPSVWQ